MLWQPILLRALITVVFGLVTVFWGDPGIVGMSLTLGAYLLAVAASHYLVVRTLAQPRGNTARTVLLGAAALLAVSGVVVAISFNAVAAAWFAGAALAVMGAAELYAALHKPQGAALNDSAPSGASLSGTDNTAADNSGDKKKSPLRGDWIVSGILGLGTGIILPFVAAAGPHALLGVSGGGAMMAGALWTLSALTLRHDGGKAKAA